MAEIAYIATVQVVLRPRAVASVAQAHGWFAGLFFESAASEDILDWGYLAVGGQVLGPTEKLVNEENYQEGDFLL